MVEAEFILQSLLITCNVGTLVSLFYAITTKRSSFEKISVLELEIFQAKRDKEKLNEKIETLIHRLIACEIRLKERGMIEYMRPSDAIIMPSSPRPKMSSEIIIKKRGPGRPPKKKEEEKTPVFTGET